MVCVCRVAKNYFRSIHPTHSPKISVSLNKIVLLGFDVRLDNVSTYVILLLSEVYQ